MQILSYLPIFSDYPLIFRRFSPIINRLILGFPFIRELLEDIRQRCLDILEEFLLVKTYLFNRPLYGIFNLSGINTLLSYDFVKYITYLLVYRRSALNQILYEILVF